MKTIRRDLREAAVSDQPHRVDRENGVIFKVKVLGQTSPNRHGLSNISGTEYTRQALESALSQYDGRQVYVDHPPRSNPGAERSMRDLVGELRSPVLESDGIYADLHYLPETEDGRRLADIAERMPKRLGLSHNATGSGKVAKGKYVIESIDTVRSVDLVTRPATTRGLYESQEPAMSKTLNQALSELKLETKANSRVSKLLLEMDGVVADAPLPPPSDAGGDSESAETHLGRSILAIVNDDSLDMAAKRKKILAILKLMDDEGSDSSSDDSSSSSSDSSGGDDAPTMESLQSEINLLKKEKKIRELCESEKFTPSKVQLKSLLLLESESDRKEFIAEAKRATAPQKGAAAPRTGSRNLTESAGGEKPQDAKGWLSRLKRPALN